MKPTKTKKLRSWSAISKDMRKAWDEMIVANLEATRVRQRELMDNDEGQSCYRDQGSHARVRDAEGKHYTAQHRYGLFERELVQKAMGE